MATRKPEDRDSADETEQPAPEPEEQPGDPEKPGVLSAEDLRRLRARLVRKYH